MEKLPEHYDNAKDGTIDLQDMVVSFYKCRVARGKKCKVEMYGTMVRVEAKESKRKAKVYHKELICVNSQSVFRAFDPTLYLTRSGAGGTVSQLMPEHVKECAEYFVTQVRYIEWLRSGFTGGLL